MMVLGQKNHANKLFIFSIKIHEAELLVIMLLQQKSGDIQSKEMAHYSRHFIALHCIALHCIALHCIALHCNVH
jgi:hypothetical protein